ncbi:MAG: succinyl-diaminopimelate desuccinylase, partial [Nocardioidaceae bacterium]|nr:succinyl-diaminopimelate desuccinylase [Nocardioidaceae bacterium]
MEPLDLDGDPVALTRRLVDIPSVSGDEQVIADAVEGALGAVDHLEVQRFGHTLVARTDHGRAHRVVLAGHLD